MHRHNTTCDDRAPICPACGKQLLGRMAVRTGGALVTCSNRLSQPRPEYRSRACGAKVALLPVRPGMVRVVALTDGEFRRVFGDERPLDVALGSAGVWLGEAA